MVRIGGYLNARKSFEWRMSPMTPGRIGPCSPHCVCEGNKRWSNSNAHARPASVDALAEPIARRSGRFELKFAADEIGVTTRGDLVARARDPACLAAGL